MLINPLFKDAFEALRSYEKISMY